MERETRVRVSGDGVGRHLELRKVEDEIDLLLGVLLGPDVHDRKDQAHAAERLAREAHHELWRIQHKANRPRSAAHAVVQRGACGACGTSGAALASCQPVGGGGGGERTHSESPQTISITR